MNPEPAPDSSAQPPASVVWLAAGGTGGHIYPALAVGRELAEAAPQLVQVYFCGNRPGELAIYRSHGIEPVALPLSGRRPGLPGLLRFVPEMLRALRRTRHAARKRAPRLAIGFGGYPSAPVLWAARSAGAVTLIQEQNALPGLANRLLGRSAARVFAGLPVEAASFPPGKTVVTGNPVRAELLAPLAADEARRTLGVADSRPVALVFGGSLGARGVNRLILKALSHPAAAGWQWIWATGPDHFDAIRRETAHRDGLTLAPYLDDMRTAYAAADLVICRAGALTLAELAALGKPSILVPLPTAAKDHQRANARQFEAAGAAFVVEEADEQAAQKIMTCMEQFAADCDKLTQLGNAARRLGRPDAAREIVNEILRYLRTEHAAPAPQRMPARSDRS
jgi:UDP-N-acetylglucosamine--N-acetylmuramyl-(pentapeptide) pyrophosphoryl-undecaprenol N-acetylglucosamine transferase